MTSLGTNYNHVQDLNRRIVLNTVRLRGPLSRADIARETRLSSPAVSSIVASLLEAGHVREAGVRAIERGRSPVDFELNPDGAYSVGLNLNRDELVGVLVDFAGAIRDKRAVVVADPTPEAVLPSMRAMIDDLASPIDPHRLRGIGVGLPGPLDHAHGAVAPLDLPGWQGVEIAKALDPTARWRVRLENNATAAAIGESWHGLGRRLQTFYYVFFGIGLGGGVVIDGRPYQGTTGNATRFGHTLVRTHEGRIVQLESLASLTYLYGALSDEGIDARTPDDLVRLHEDGNPLLERELDAIAEALVLPVANVERQFDPEAIVFGGRMPRPVLRALVDRIDRLLVEVGSDVAHPIVLTLAEAGDEAAAVGAATLPLYQAHAPDHDLVVIDGRHKEAP